MTPALIIALVAAFLSLSLVVYAMGQVLGGFFDRHERLWLGAQKRSDSKLGALIDFLKTVLVKEGRELRSIDRIHSQLKRDVVRANAAFSADEYLGQSLLEGLLILIGGAAFCLFLFGPMSLFMPFVFAIAWTMWIRPSLVGSDGEKRSRAVYRRIPYALDLGVLVLEAGGTLREALEVVAKNKDPLAEELRTALKEIDSGASQAAALQNMSDRVGIEALDTIVLAINRGEETGAPMAQTLTIQAELFRERRLQEVEKLAVEAPTKMTFPNMMIMLSVLIIVVGPLIVKITTSGLL